GIHAQRGRDRLANIANATVVRFRPRADTDTAKRRHSLDDHSFLRVRFLKAATRPPREGVMGLRVAVEGAAVVRSLIVSTFGVAFACAGLATSPIVSAQVAEHPEWNIGDKWTYQERASSATTESEWSRQVMERVSDGRYRVRTEVGGELTFDG